MAIERVAQDGKVFTARLGDDAPPQLSAASVSSLQQQWTWEHLRSQSGCIRERCHESTQTGLSTVAGGSALSCPDNTDELGAAPREPTVIQAAVVTGSADVLLLAVARDMTRYRELLRRLTDAFPSLKNVTTLVMLQEVKPGFAVPIESLDDNEAARRDR